MKSHNKSVSCISAKKEIEILNLKKIIKKEFNAAKNKLNFMHYYISKISDNEFDDFKLKFKINLGEGTKDDFINLVISEFDIIKKKIDEPIDYTKEIERSSSSPQGSVEGVVEEAAEGVVEGVADTDAKGLTEGVV